MEVSSHALAMGRVDGTCTTSRCSPTSPRTTSTSTPTCEDYFAAKATLFTPRAVASRRRRRRRRVGPAAGRARDACRSTTVSPSGARRRLAGRGRRGRTGGQHASRSPGPDGVRRRLRHRAGRATSTSPTPRWPSSTLVQAGVDPDDGGGRAGVDCPGVPGRMERVDDRRRRARSPLVDYAHTPGRAGAAARHRARAGRRPAAGWSSSSAAGGDRDRRKRPVMGATPRAAPTSSSSPTTTRAPRTRAAIRRRGARAARTALPTAPRPGSRSRSTGRAAIRRRVRAGRPGRRRRRRRQGPRAGPGDRRRRAPVRRPRRAARGAARRSPA